MICTQWIWIVEFEGRVIGYYADEYTAQHAVKKHVLGIARRRIEDYNLFKVPVMQES